MKTRYRTIAPALFCLAFYSVGSPAADYLIDTKGYHASINFKISHLGYSWMIGRFNSFNGSFSYLVLSGTSEVDRDQQTTGAHFPLSSKTTLLRRESS